ncbi:unnamed protein product [Larinioides sclopetarius]|uniref:Uncharacterized protein n=1 Tax=Larinioides sclopetarius TaxID=280406 RepID=A0AAV2BPT8_9ARAC
MNIVVGQTTCRKDEYEYANTDECDLETGISAFKMCVVVVFREPEGDHRLMGSGCRLAEKDEVEGI